MSQSWRELAHLTALIRLLVWIHALTLPSYNKLISRFSESNELKETQQT